MFCRPRVAARGAPAGARTLRAPRLRRATKSETRRTAGDTAEADGTAEAGKHVGGTAEADGHVGDTVAAERTGAAHFSLAEVLLLVPEWGMHKLMMAAAALVVVQAPATAAEWMTDYEAACERAAAEDKMVLIDFTGSDWCSFCIQLRCGVLDKPDFEAYARARFVLLEVDLPNNSKFDPKLRAANEALCRAFGIRSFPTMLVVTPHGDVAGGFLGYRPDLAAVREELEPALANARAIEAARQLEGEARRDALMSCYRAMHERLRICAKGLRAEIMRSDPQDVYGLRDRVLNEQQMDEINGRLETLEDDPAAARDYLEALLPSARPANRLALLNLLYPLQIKAADSLDELEAARRTMLEILSCKPPYAESIRRRLESKFADPEELLRQVRTQRRLRGNARPPQP